MAGRRLLLVAMQASVHVARWVELLQGQGWDVHVFAFDHAPSHARLQGVTLHFPLGGLLNKTKLARFLLRTINRFWRVRLGESSITAPFLHGPGALKRLVEKLKPDVVHSMEFQHCGYLTLAAKGLYKETFPRWIATNWGSDIYYFRQFEEHALQIARLLENCEYYSAECERDIGLAREMGFRGAVLPVLPNSGGFDLERIKQLRGDILPSQRRLVLVKGYQHFAGRALTAMDAIEKVQAAFEGYRIRVFLATPDVKQRMGELRSKGMDIEALPYMEHDALLRLYGEARLYLGVSISDAISTSLLEAMVMGAFPIQTHTSCCEEWVKDGESGFVIPPDDVAVIADRLVKALENDALVDQAALHNWQTAVLRLDKQVLKEKVRRFYAQAMGEVA